ncbi:MAG: AAA family ATPase [Lachnospiraceae bacterium]
MELTFDVPGDGQDRNKKTKAPGEPGIRDLSSLYGDLYGSEESSKKALQQAQEALSAIQKTFLSGEERNHKTAEEIYQEVEKDFGAAPGTLSGKTGGEAPVPQETPSQKAPSQEETANPPDTDPMDDLNSLIGLSSIKHDVKELYDFTRVQKLREDAGLATVPVSKHLVFTGNPGTGKTTVARILARLYKKIGVLSRGQLVECDRSGLVAGYVGQTAVKTRKKIEEAMGGVLFVDEAYTLAKGGQENDFGQEAIDTILKAMEDHRDDFIVIVAGYTEPMERFINSNPGLRSRFNKYIEFPDYTDEELMQIFAADCKKYQYTCGEGVEEGVAKELSRRRAAAGSNFANAREVRNLFEEIVTNQAGRVAGMEHPDREAMQTILTEDLTDPEDPHSLA